MLLKFQEIYYYIIIVIIIIFNTHYFTPELYFYTNFMRIF